MALSRYMGLEGLSFSLGEEVAALMDAAAAEECAAIAGRECLAEEAEECLAIV